MPYRSRRTSKSRPPLRRTSRMYSAYRKRRAYKAGVRRNYYARKAYWSNRRYMRPRGAGTLFPEKLDVVLPYKFQYDTSAAYSSVDLQTLNAYGSIGRTWSLNSFYNPQGITPPTYTNYQYYDQLAAIYDKYIIKWVDVKMQVHNYHADDLNAVVLIQKGTPAYSTQNWAQYLVQPWSQFRFIRGTNSLVADVGHFHFFVKPRQFQGLMRPTDIYSAIDDDPDDLITMQLYGMNNIGTGYSVILNTQLKSRILLSRTQPVDVKGPATTLTAAPQPEPEPIAEVTEEKAPEPQM